MNSLRPRHAHQHRVAVIEVDSPNLVRFNSPPQFSHQVSIFRWKYPDDCPLKVTRDSVYLFWGSCEVVSFEVEPHAADLGVVGRNANGSLVSQVVDDHFSHFWSVISTFRQVSKQARVVSSVHFENSFRIVISFYWNSQFEISKNIVNINLLMCC